MRAVVIFPEFRKEVFVENNVGGDDVVEICRKNGYKKLNLFDLKNYGSFIATQPKHVNRDFLFHDGKTIYEFKGWNSTYNTKTKNITANTSITLETIGEVIFEDGEKKK